MKNNLLIIILIILSFNYKACAAIYSFGPNGNFINGVKYDSDESLMRAVRNTEGYKILGRQFSVIGKTYPFHEDLQQTDYTISAIINVYIPELASFYIIYDDSMDNELLKNFITYSNYTYDLQDPIYQANIRTAFKILNNEVLCINERLTNAKDLTSIASFQMPDTLTTDVLSISSEAITGVVDHRISDFNENGVAAGGFPQSLGLWIKSLYTKANQKNDKITLDYKFNQTGIITGIDTGDDIKFGVAYSYSKSNVTSKFSRSKEDLINHIGTIYGSVKINDQLFTSGQGNYGISNIKKSRPTRDIDDNKATGSTKGTIKSGKLEVGYNYKVNNFSVNIVPTAGIAYNVYNVKGYKETGEGLNRKIGSRAATRTSALLGIMTKYIAQIEDFTLVPEVHANVNYILDSKNDNTKITLIDKITPLVMPSSKLTKLKYNFGTSIKLIEHKYLYTEVGYDYSIAKKFSSHTGSINFRVEF